MSKTQKELAFLRDLYIETDWTERFTNLFDDNFKFTKEEKVLYVNAGTGSHALALRKKLKEKVELFAQSETKELLKIAQAKADAVKADVQFSTDFPKGKFDAVLADASLVKPNDLKDFLIRIVESSEKQVVFFFADGGQLRRHLFVSLGNLF
jgi:ubiquinone/menaquinone biosynthesis C-methylase UbiE